MTVKEIINEKVMKRLRQLDDQSRLEGKGKAKISWDDIHLLSVLGMGGFGTVYKVSVTRDVDGILPKNQSLALKCVDPSKITSRAHLVAGATDLVVEANVLSQLDHPNIIKLHGVCSSTLSESYHDNNDKGYFLLLEVLKETLSSRIKEDRFHEDHRTRSINPFSERKRTRSRMLNNIENIALSVAKAMEYLHKQDIILRDLKPDNVGFDNDGNVKIFDFGLARNVNDYDKAEVAGTYRYMSPESMLGQCSGRPSDVYSFGLLLWELCTLETPFSEFTNRQELKQSVTIDLQRPCTRDIPDKKIRFLIKQCWAADPASRPTFAEIHTALLEILYGSVTKKKEIEEKTKSCHKSIITPPVIVLPLQKASTSLGRRRGLSSQHTASGRTVLSESDQ